MLRRRQVLYAYKSMKSSSTEDGDGKSVVCVLRFLLHTSTW
jgi:hypothetical protein